ncbi:hypothetical protein CSW10_00185 [Mesomycoplasma dispar]|uniref:Uncharacterized protein n=1 Tax=Mesomycoplasma dispar TaxID=86660 RepID=A0ABN5DVI8_9BACT|nr:hypothetical protein CSW10_00185 [Mesomycoplasma dispar]
MKKTLYLYLKIFFAISIILSFVAIWNYSLIFGWLFSLISVLTSVFSKYLFLNKITNNAKRKIKTTVFIAFFAYMFFVLLQASIFTTIFFINKTFTTNDSQQIYSIFFHPINIISFIFGYTIFPISAIIYNSMLKYKK